MGALLILGGIGAVVTGLAAMSGDEPSAVHRPSSHSAWESGPAMLIGGLLAAIIGFMMLVGM